MCFIHIRTYPARNNISTYPWRAGETNNAGERKMFYKIQVNNLNRIANITINTIHLYYWRKCNIYICGANETWFVAQMKDIFSANEIPISAKAMRRNKLAIVLVVGKKK